MRAAWEGLPLDSLKPPARPSPWTVCVHFPAQWCKPWWCRPAFPRSAPCGTPGKAVHRWPQRSTHRPRARQGLRMPPPPSHPPSGCSSPFWPDCWPPASETREPILRQDQQRSLPVDKPLAQPQQAQLELKQLSARGSPWACEGPRCLHLVQEAPGLSSVRAARLDSAAGTLGAGERPCAPVGPPSPLSWG